MATTKKQSFITEDLDWCEQKLTEWKAYVDNHPIHELKHDIEWKATKSGGMMPMVIASIQVQGKFLQDTLKNVLAMLELVDKLREKEEAKVETRGKAEMSAQAGEWLKNRKG